VFILLVGPSIPLLLALPWIVQLISLTRYNESLELLLTLVMSIAGWGAFLNALYAPLYSAVFWRAGIREGWVPPSESDYFLELARYQEARGTNGQFPGDATWGIAYYLIYVGTGVAGSIFVLALFPSWGPWVFFAFAAVEFPVAIVCWLIYGRRTQDRLEQAEAAGFHLLQLRKAIARQRNLPGRR
jgi:uncharacterized protein with PQ loop repeat